MSGEIPHGTADVKRPAVVPLVMKDTRAPFALAFALVLLSGCLTPPPATAPSTTTTTSASTTPPATTDPAATPGEAPGPRGGMLVRPAHAENASDGFGIVGDESASGIHPPGSATFTFVGTNVGAAAEALFDPCGRGNPRIWIEDANGTMLSLQPPTMHCMAAMGFGSIAHNESRTADLTWNGTAYRGEQAYTAPAGPYHVVGEFEGRRNGTIVDVRVSLPFNVVSQPGVL